MKIREELAKLGVTTVRDQAELEKAGALPPWLGDEEFHRSHRSSLLNKDPEWYGDVFTDVPPDLPYIWPSKAGGRRAELKRASDRDLSRCCGAARPPGAA